MSEMFPFPQKTPLADELRTLIAQEGPMSFERYMGLCLGHPEHGYYMNRDPFGALGDFITAPEISQVFGELIGLWIADVWQNMGSPPSFHLIELGAGRGTLMKDALRALKVLPECFQAAHIHIVDMSPALQRIQVATLKDHSISWHTSIETLPEGTSIIIANEFFDALPVRQYQRYEGHWYERMITVDTHGALQCCLSPSPEMMLQKEAEEGAILELSPHVISTIATLAGRIEAQGGALLIIDYGYASPAMGDTVQALKDHEPIDVLATPGEADITAHVNFPSLKATAERFGCKVYGAVTQADFLESLGLHLRVAMLKKRADETQCITLDEGAKRLTERTPKGMGSLFKVMAVTHSSLYIPQGLSQT
jgi:NADH dehydrogenase [ubiquinone] 1 alpha subcomplex assembly factor 7